MKKRRAINILLALAAAGMLLFGGLLLAERQDVAQGEAQRDLKPAAFAEGNLANDLAGEGGEAASPSATQSGPLGDEGQDAAGVAGAIASLQRVNPDIVGWLTVDGTQIDYPIVHGKDNDYYLTHTAERKESKTGAIFMDYRNNTDFSDFNTILYGHNLKSGRMFAGIHQFQQQAYFDAHQTGTLYAGDAAYPLRIIACAIADDDGAYYDIALISPALQSAHMEMIQKTAAQCRLESPDISQKLLTLSTCSYEGQKARIVIVAQIGGAS